MGSLRPLQFARGAVDLRRVTALEIGGEAQVLRDIAIRRQVRSALAHHLGLDLPASLDGAA